MLSRLIEVIRTICEITDRDGVDMDMPTRECEAVWLEITGKRGSSKRQKVRVIDYQNVSELVSDLLVKIRRVNNSVDSLAQIAKSIPDRELPAYINKEDDGLKLVHEIIVRYITDTRSFVVNKEIARSICKGFVEEKNSTQWSTSSIFQVTNFKANRRFEIDNEVYFRPVSMEDHKRYATVDTGKHVGFNDFMLESTDWICEIICTGPKKPQVMFFIFHEPIKEVVDALNLTATGRSRFTLLEHRQKSRYLPISPVASWGPSCKDIYSGGMAGEVTLDEKKIGEFSRNYKMVKRVSKESRFEPLRLPLERLRMATSRRKTEDQLVDYVIGLEALLVHDSKKRGITSRFKSRGAAVLPSEDYGTKIDRKEFMGRLYEPRGDILHGKKTNKKEVKDITPRGERALADVIKWYYRAFEKANKLEEINEELDKAMIDGGHN